RAAECPLTREDGKSLGKACHASAFLIDRDEERHCRRQFLKSVDQVRRLRRLLEVPAEENHATGMIVLKESAKILRDFRSLEAKHEKLTDLLFQIHVVLLTLLSHPPALGAPRRAFFLWPTAPFFTFAPCRPGDLE